MTSRFFDKARIVCLCGSTRFYEAFQESNFVLTLEGWIVLSVGFYPHAADKAHAAHVGVSSAEKHKLDLLHLKKIELCERVHVLNVDGYVGASTAREIAFAIARGRDITWYHTRAGEDWLELNSHMLGKMVAGFASLDVPALAEPRQLQTSHAMVFDLSPDGRKHGGGEG